MWLAFSKTSRLLSTFYIKRFEHVISTSFHIHPTSFRLHCPHKLLHLAVLPDGHQRRIDRRSFERGIYKPWQLASSAIFIYQESASKALPIQWAKKEKHVDPTHATLPPIREQAEKITNKLTKMAAGFKNKYFLGANKRLISQLVNPCNTRGTPFARACIRRRLGDLKRGFLENSQKSTKNLLPVLQRFSRSSRSANDLWP